MTKPCPVCGTQTAGRWEALPLCEECSLVIFQGPKAAWGPLDEPPFAVWELVIRMFQAFKHVQAGVFDIPGDQAHMDILAVMHAAVHQMYEAIGQPIQEYVRLEDGKTKDMVLLHQVSGFQGMDAKGRPWYRSEHDDGRGREIWNVMTGPHWGDEHYDYEWGWRPVQPGDMPVNYMREIDM